MVCSPAGLLSHSPRHIIVGKIQSLQCLHTNNSFRYTGRGNHSLLNTRYPHLLLSTRASKKESLLMNGLLYPRLSTYPGQGKCGGVYPRLSTFPGQGKCGGVYPRLSTYPGQGKCGGVYPRLSTYPGQGKCGGVYPRLSTFPGQGKCGGVYLCILLSLRSR